VPKPQADLLPGTLEMLVLQKLSPGPKHGYAIAKSIRALSEGVLAIERGSFFAAVVPAALSLLVACSSPNEVVPDPFDPTVLPQFPLTELVEIGRDNNDAQPVLNKVTDALFLGTEEIALASDHGEILVYGVQGDFRRRFGRQGEGPGEFRFIQSIVRLDDNQILAWDPALDRVTAFDQDGILAFTCTPPWALSRQAGVGFVGAFGDGSFVLEDRSNLTSLQNGSEGLRSDTIPYALFDRSGELVRTVGQLVRRPRYYDSQSGYQSYLLDTFVLSRIVGDELVLGETDSIVLIRFDSSGTSLPRLSLERDTRRVTELDIEAGWRAWADQAAVQLQQFSNQAVALNRPVAAPTKARVDEALARAKETIVPAEFLPAFKSIIVGSDRTLWVEDYLHPTEEVSRWIMMGVDFLPVGWIELPPNEQLLATGPNSVIVLRKDQLDVESVVIYSSPSPTTRS
jgi:hypothetical protein